MTPSQLKAKHLELNPESLYFTRDSMRFFGDTMSNYRVPAKPVIVETILGERFTCYELQRKRAVNGGLKTSAYFDINTFKRILGEPIEGQNNV